MMIHATRSGCDKLTFPDKSNPGAWISRGNRDFTLEIDFRNNFFPINIECIMERISMESIEEQNA